MGSSPGKPKAAGVHVYSGLWTIGWTDDFDVVGQWEELDAASETAALNLPKMNIPHIVAPVEEWPLDEFADELDLLFANPPCAPWSAAGGKKGMADERTVFTKTAAETALKLQPTFFAMESVPRAWNESPKGGRDLYTELAERFWKRGYGVTIFFTNAVLHGAPQFRQRFHFIAHKYDLDFDPPSEIKARTVRDSIGDIEDSAIWFGDGDPVLPNHVSPQPSLPLLNVINRLGQGEGWDTGYKRTVEDGVDGKKGRFIAGRLRYDAPSSTVVDINAMVHPTAPRFLTVREAARLCGYPDWYEFAPHGKGGYGIATSDISQAVLPEIGRYLGRVFNRALDVAHRSRSGTIDVVDFRPLARHLSPSKYKT